MLDGCLAAICASIDDKDEVTVVDSASRGADVRTVAARYSAKYIRCDTPGASLARNVGWQSSLHTIVAFVDDDVRVSADWASAYRRVFEDHSDVSFATGKVLPAGRAVVREVATMDREDAMAFRAGVRDSPGHSANLAVRREALAEIGGFDERLGAGGDFRAAEDGDLFDRLYAAGRLGRYEPEALAWHDQWRSARQIFFLDFSYGFGAGARVAKLLRTNRVHGLKYAKALYWGWGLHDAWKCMRLRAPFQAVSAVSRFVGAVVGLLRTLLVPVRNGHFAKATLIRSRRR